MGSRQHQLQQSQVKRQTLDDPELRAALQALCQLFGSCMGPHGCIKSVQNNIGGPLILTSCSSRLLHAMSFSRPCLRIIVDAVQSHLKNHHDGGLLAGSLCLHLINSALSVETVQRRYLREMFEVLLEHVDKYLNLEECPVRVNVDASSVRVMLAYVRSIIAKPVCGLNAASLEHTSHLILRAFLNSVPDAPKSFLSDRIFILHFPGTDVMSSEVKEGLLIECPEISPLRGEQDLETITVQDGTSSVKVVLVTVSMSGDTEESVDVAVQARPELIAAALEFVLSKMVAFCDWLVEAGVGLLLCQKVIHPRIKSYLREKGILFVDRLGIQPVTYLQDLTGATPVTSVMVSPSKHCCGLLTAVTHNIIHSRSYLHLQHPGSCVSTLLLCASLEEQVAELNTVVQSAVRGLYSVIQRPQVLCGGGCWQIHLAHFVRHMVHEKSSELTTLLHLSKAQLHITAAAFSQSLEATACSLLQEFSHAWVDAENWHIWHFPRGVDATQETGPFRCACGLLSNSDIDKNNLQQLAGLARSGYNEAYLKRYMHRQGPQNAMGNLQDQKLVLDSFSNVVSAIRTAVVTACTVLSITQVVYDTN